MRKIASPSYTVQGFVSRVRNKDGLAQGRKVALNTDVLAIVFDALLSLSPNPNSCKDLGAIRLVCSTWNATTVSHPELWRFVVVHGRSALAVRHSETLPILLARSGNCSIFATLDFSGALGTPAPSLRVCSKICAVLERYMERVHSLRIILDDDAQSSALWKLGGASPRLRALSIEYTNHAMLLSGEWPTLDTGILRLDMSRLHSVRLSHTGRSFFDPTTQFPSLQTLVLVDSAFAWPEIEGVFDACPALEDFTIKGFSIVPPSREDEDIPDDELTLTVPLRRLAIDRTYLSGLNPADLLSAFARLPLRTTAEVEIGPTFPVWHSETLRAALETLFDHLPVLETLAVKLDDASFAWEGTPLDPRREADAQPFELDTIPEGASTDFPHSHVSRTVHFGHVHGTSKTELRRIQNEMRDALGTALSQPKPAFERLTALRLPLSFWNFIPSQLDDMFPYLIELDVEWDLRSFDEGVPALPRLTSLGILRLVKPVRRNRMVLTVDKVEKLLRQYWRPYTPVLVLREVQIIMLEQDLDRHVARVIIDD